MVSVRDALTGIASTTMPLKVRHTLERYDIYPVKNLRAIIEGLAATRPKEGSYFKYSDADKRRIERKTKVVVDDYKKIDNGKWNSYIHKNIIDYRIDAPTVLSDVREIMRNANDRGVTVKAVGSGHSFSDIYKTEGWLVDTHNLSGEIPLNLHWLQDRPVGMEDKVVDASNELIQIKAGTTIERLNQILDDKGQALFNMGGYDGQTFVGAASTSTHGTGIELPPFCDMILSLVIVCEKGLTLRIEPENGITNPLRYPASEPTLIQDDKSFYSVIVSLGCMGIIYSVVIQVREQYFLEERQSVHPWNDLSVDLQSNNYRPTALSDSRHFNVLINPYVSSETLALHRNERMCMITTLNEVPHVLVESPARRADSGLEIEAGRALRFLNAEQIAQAINGGFDASLLLPYASRSHKAFIAGGKEIGGYGTEWSFPLNAYHDALEVIFQTLSSAENTGDQLQCAPISLRYVKRSKAYLSPQYGRDSCMIELLNLFGTPGWPNEYVLMHRYYDALIKLGGRPHWGLEFNNLSSDPPEVPKLYPAWNTWLSVYQRLNSTGVFNNEFTDRLGISM